MISNYKYNVQFSVILLSSIWCCWLLPFLHIICFWFSCYYILVTSLLLIWPFSNTFPSYLFLCRLLSDIITHVYIHISSKYTFSEYRHLDVSKRAHDQQDHLYLLSYLSLPLAIFERHHHPFPGSPKAGNHPRFLPFSVHQSPKSMILLSSIYLLFVFSDYWKTS